MTRPQTQRCVHCHGTFHPDGPPPIAATFHADDGRYTRPAHGVCQQEYERSLARMGARETELRRHIPHDPTEEASP